MQMVIELQREGQFSLRFKESNASQCGVSGTLILDYAVTIVGDNRHLNGNGFLIDNDEIDHYFQTTYATVQTFESCERIAERACEDLKALCESTGTKVWKLDVTISGNPKARLTARWRAPKLS